MKQIFIVIKLYLSKNKYGDYNFPFLFSAAE